MKFNLIISLKLILIHCLSFDFINCEKNKIDFYDNELKTGQNFDIFKDNFDSLAEELLKSLKIAHKLDEKFDENEDKRVKRSVDYYHSSRRSFIDEGVHRLRGIIPLFPTCAQPLDFTTIKFDGNVYGICMTQASDPNPAKITVGPITADGWESNQMVWTAKDPQNIVSFVYQNKETKESNLYVLTADSGNRDGTDVVVINKENQRVGKEQHTVNSQYPTAIAVWKSRTDNTYHLAIANSRGPEEMQTYRSETYAYNWMETYFDKYSSITTYLVKDICPFNIHSNEFLAIANFKAGPNAVDVDSEIFKLDIDRKKWISFQRIRTYGAVDWEFFTFGSHHNEEYFLSVANNFNTSKGQTVFDVKSIIYKFSDDKFVPFQCLPTVGATQVKSFKGRNGEFVLAVANIHQAVHLYQYNGWHFIETNVQYTSGVMSPGVVSLHFDYLPNERSGVLFVSNPRHPSGHAFKMDFVHENPLGQWFNRSLELCRKTDEEVMRFANDMKSIFNGVYYVDQREPIVINDDIVFEEVITDSLSTPQLIDESNDEELSNKLIEELIELDLEMNKIEETFGRIVDVLNNALRTSGEQVVTAPMTFKSVDFECRPGDQCNVKEINTQILNNNNVVNLWNDVLTLNTDNEIPHSLQFEDIRVDKDFKLNGLINDFNTSNIVTKHGNHDIIGRKTFAQSLTANEVTVNHLINEKVITSSTVLLTNRNQEINNTIKFDTNIKVMNIQVNGLINGHKIDKLYQEMITKDRDHIIIGQKYFHELEINDLDMTPGSTIDGIDIMKIWSDVLWTYGDQNIVIPINFSNVMIDGNLFIDGRLNGIRIPEDILLTNQNAIITGLNEFSTEVKFEKMEVMNGINGIGFIGRNPEWNLQLDIMTKSIFQVINGQKVLNGIHLIGHTLVAGTVDGVKLSELQRNILFRNNSRHFNTLEITGDAFFNSGIDLKNTISGVKLEQLYNNALKLRDYEIPSFAHLKLNNAIINSLNCYSINGLNIGIDLMTKHTPQVITGRKTFVKGLKIDNDLTVNVINGIDMSFLNDALFHESEQYISGHKVFSGDLWVNRLSVRNINNISMDDIVVLNRNETITAQKIFRDIHVLNDLNVESLETQVINGVDLKDLFENSLLFDRKQIITGRMSFESILIPNKTNLETNSVNGIDLRQLMSDAVLKDIPQSIFGSKTFVSPLTVNHFKFNRDFDGVTDYEMKNNWLLQDVNQVIRGNIVFNHNVRVNDNVFMKIPVINGIDLNQLNNNTVKTDESTLVKGNVQFLGPTVSSGHIQLKGKFQGIDLDKEAVTLTGNHRINGQILFNNGFNVNENLFVNGTVDEVIVEQLCRTTARKNANQVITGSTKVVGNLILKGAVTVGTAVNGINVEELFRSVVKVDEPAHVRGVKRFKTLIIESMVGVKESIAGINIEILFNNYMSLTRDQIINSKIVFRNDLNFNKLVTINGSLNTQNGLINGINLRHLDSNVLKTHGNQLITGEFVFEDNVNFGNQLIVQNNKINGIDLNADLMIRGRNNVINVPKVFEQNIVVEQNVDVFHNKTINEIDISEMAKNSVMKSGRNYQIFGNKHFKSLEIDELICGPINSIEISDKNLLLNYGNQQIIGSKVFKNDLTVNSEINANQINGIDIQHLSQRLVLKGYNNSINSMKTFHSPLTVHNVQAFGKVDSVDVNELNYFIGLPIDLLDLRIRLMAEDEKIDSMQLALDHQSLHLAYYELVYGLNSGHTLLAFYEFSTKSEHIFISGHYLNNGCQEILIQEHSNNMFRPYGKLNAISANSMITYTLSGDRFILISNAKIGPIPQCIQQNPSSAQLFHFGNGPSVTQVFRFDQNKKQYTQIGFIHTELVFGMKVIQDQYISPCFVFAIPVSNRLFTNSIVICMDFNGNFRLSEALPLIGKDQIAILKSQIFNTTLLASTNSWQTTQSLSEISINHWSSQIQHFDHSVKSIQFMNPLAIHFAESPRDLAAFLFASEKKTTLSHRPIVRIFKYNHKHAVSFVEVQQIVGSEVLLFESIITVDNHLMVFMLINDRIDIYRLKGSSGFVKVDRIVAQNAYSFMVFGDYDINYRMNGHLVSIAYEKDCDFRHKYMNQLCREENIFLKSKIIGRIPH